MTASPISLADAAEVFVRGLAIVRSMTYSYTVNLADGAWMLRAEPDREKARASELTAVEPTVEQIHARVAAVSPALRRWMLCYLEPEDPVAPPHEATGTGRLPRRRLSTSEHRAAVRRRPGPDPPPPASKAPSSASAHRSWPRGRVSPTAAVGN